MPTSWGLHPGLGQGAVTLAPVVDRVLDHRRENAGGGR
jgi:hypothetical protein